VAETSIRDDSRPAVLPDLGVACAFRPEFLDFQRGIHVGNLNDHERITRILKLALEARYGQPFVTERWGVESTGSGSAICPAPIGWQSPFPPT
jgi:hypothetical protein